MTRAQKRASRPDQWRPTISRLVLRKDARAAGYGEPREALRRLVKLLGNNQTGALLGVAKSQPFVGCVASPFQSKALVEFSISTSHIARISSATHRQDRAVAHLSSSDVRMGQAERRAGYGRRRARRSCARRNRAGCAPLSDGFSPSCVYVFGGRPRKRSAR